MQFAIGSKYRVLDIDYSHPAAKALVDMGLTKGVVIEVSGKAPLGDPILITVRNYSLAIRKNDLKVFSLEQIKNT